MNYPLKDHYYFQNFVLSYIHDEELMNIFMFSLSEMFGRMREL